MSACGVIVSASCTVMRSRTTRSIRVRPMRNWFCNNSPTQRKRRLPKWSISSTFPNPSIRFNKYPILAIISSFVIVRWSYGKLLLLQIILATVPSCFSTNTSIRPSKLKTPLSLILAISSAPMTVCAGNTSSPVSLLTIGSCNVKPKRRCSQPSLRAAL